MSLRDKAERLAALHRGPRPLVLLNAWDAGSARVLEAAGAAAIGTTSAGIAYARGRPDGGISREQMLEAVGRIAAAVDVPVTADIESGFGDTPQAVGETVRLVLAAGAVGVNLEDVDVGGEQPLFAIEDQTARVRAARAAADEAGISLFINARTDVYWLKLGAEDERFGLALERLSAYVDAGADGVFAPALFDRDVIARMVQAVRVPLNLVTGAALPPVAELAQLGVARVSTGSGPNRAALGLLQRIARELIDDGTYTAMSDGALPYDEANALW